MKSGCRVEFLQHRRDERIERAVTINAVIAWRLAAMSLLGRETPELPMKVPLARPNSAHSNRYRLSAPDNLGAGVVTLAMIAGYLNRKNNPTPGCKKIWESYIKLVAMSQV